MRASDPPLTSAIAVEIIGCFTLKRPPKPQQLSGSSHSCERRSKSVAPSVKTDIPKGDWAWESPRPPAR